MEEESTTGNGCQAQSTHTPTHSPLCHNNSYIVADTTWALSCLPPYHGRREVGSRFKGHSFRRRAPGGHVLLVGDNGGDRGLGGGAGHGGHAVVRGRWVLESHHSSSRLGRDLPHAVWSQGGLGSEGRDLHLPGERTKVSLMGNMVVRERASMQQ